MLNLRLMMNRARVPQSKMPIKKTRNHWKRPLILKKAKFSQTKAKLKMKIKMVIEMARLRTLNQILLVTKHQVLQIMA